MRLAWLLVAVLVTACAPARITLEPAVRHRLPAAETIHVVVYPTDGPGLLTAKAIGTGAMFGPVGGAIAGARAAVVGKELREKQKVERLSVLLANALVDELKTTLPNLKRATTTPPNDEPAELKKAGLRPLVLDVLGDGNIIYHATSWARYRLLYGGRARLIDTDTGTVLWQGVCTHKGEEEPDKSPTLDELEADDGVAYRRMVDDATAFCAKSILEQFRGTAPKEAAVVTPGDGAV